MRFVLYGVSFCKERQMFLANECDFKTIFACNTLLDGFKIDK